MILDMLSVTHCRKVLGKCAEKMTNSEIERLKDMFVVLSDLAIDSYLAKRKCILDENQYEKITG